MTGGDKTLSFVQEDLCINWKKDKNGLI